ncbi:TOBE domain-containing protein [Timonella senegalensis]|uniref:TOBE domain-containing protein n=1 Tax=Timonella senegalensis TaxID=1465825 RepID=UPI002FDEB52A
MAKIRISAAASVMGVSDDTIRRWIDSGRLTADTDDSGKRVVDGAELVALAEEIAQAASLEHLDGGAGHRSARNHLTGLVSRIVSDQVMSQVELQCGNYRVVSLISTEAVQDLGLEVGSIATAVIKSTNVSIEGPRP